jgi:hypothetical protein
MGHERLGFLPKTRKWRDLVNQISRAESFELQASEIAVQTLRNVQDRYEALYNDQSVLSAFEFLVTFSFAFRQPNPSEYLANNKIKVPREASLLSLIQAIRERVGENKVRSEYGYFAITAAIDALSQWHKINTSLQLRLYKPSEEFIDSWNRLGSGAGFCEIAQLYFGNLTERYLNYFLDREASSVIRSIDKRNRLRSDIRNYTQEISKYAFETANITKSFAAGWFNKNAREDLPNKRAINNFLGVAFGKMRSELQLEVQRPQI